MAVVLPNCSVIVYRPDGTQVAPTPGSPDETTNANMQKADFSRGAPPEFAGLGIENLPTHRIRIDTPRSLEDSDVPTGIVPTKGDRVFVAVFPACPHLLGGWTIEKTEDDTGRLASMLLYVQREKAR